MPRARSNVSFRFFCSCAERNISATQVLLQLNWSSGRTSSACRTACKLAPHTVQNFTSSLCAEAHLGQVIRNSLRSLPEHTPLEHTTSGLNQLLPFIPLVENNLTTSSDRPSGRCDMSHDNSRTLSHPAWSCRR